MDNISVNMIPIDSTLNSQKYDVIISIPMIMGWIENVQLKIIKGHELLTFDMSHQKNENDKAFFTTQIELETRAIYHYYFDCYINGIKWAIINDKLVSPDDIDVTNMNKMSVNFKVPDWAKGKVMYHIFVDRYRRGSQESLPHMNRRVIHQSWYEDMLVGPDEQGIWNNDFYGGDLQGIIETLDYIKSLGVSIIYLSPISWSQSNHRYDISDYEFVDPYAGNNADLKQLCDIAHAKGMKVILDAVFNHTGNDSKYFNKYKSFDGLGAYHSTESPYSSFYKKYIEHGEVKYCYWWGMTNLVVCDSNSKEWRDYILGEDGIIDQWFKLGIDGLRLDVADELTDDFINNIRIAVKRNKEDGFILGEVWKNPMRMNRGYIESGLGMDSVMNYSMIDALIRYFKYDDIHKLVNIINDIKREYPDDTINSLMNFTSTHDISRAINIFATDDFDINGEWAWNLKNNDLKWCQNFKLTIDQYRKGRDLYEAYVFALTFLPGILSIFYGDEVGVQGIGNLVNRKTYPWKYRDKKLLSFFRNMGQIRKEESFLEDADLEIVDINHNYLMFERLSKEEQALVTVNRTSNECYFNVPDKYYDYDKVYTLKNSRLGYLTPNGGITIKKKR